MLIMSCAKVSSPTGGPRDESPPVVLSSEPENESVYFDERGFQVTFDEYFVLDNVDQVLMISPPLNKKPKIQVRGKTLKLELDEEEVLMDSMTYSFNFLNSIKDLNENNPIENFKYVFSTGDVIDSLSVTGYIYDAFNLEAGEEIFVLMHSGMSDTLPETSLPAYITKAADNGKFRIDNIAAGEYKIYGLKDDNNNKLFDLPTEAFAYLDSSIFISADNNYIPSRPDSLVAVQDTVSASPEEEIMETETEVSEPVINEDSLKYERIPGREYELFYFITDNKKQYLMGTDRTLQYMLQLTFALPVDTGSVSIQFADAGEEASYLTDISAGSDTLKLWLTDSSFYNRERITLYLEYPETDSLGNLQQVADTVSMRYRETTSRRGTGRGTAAVQLPLRTNLSQPSGIKPGQKPVFIFNSPMLDPDTTKIRLYRRSDTLQIDQGYKIFRDSLNNKKFYVECDLFPDSSYVLLLNKGGFSNIYGHLNDSTAYNFKVRNPDQFGKLVLNLNGFEGNIILQLMDTGEKIVRDEKIKLPEESSIEFEYLDPKEYLLKAIFDLDGNGEWTTGDYHMDKQPEPVTYYSKKIEVKKGWEMIEDWQLAGIRKKANAISPTRGKKEEK